MLRSGLSAASGSMTLKIIWLHEGAQRHSAWGGCYRDACLMASRPDKMMASICHAQDGLGCDGHHHSAGTVARDGHGDAVPGGAIAPRRFRAAASFKMKSAP
jgi:hypothetical protein